MFIILLFTIHLQFFRSLTIEHNNSKNMDKKSLEIQKIKEIVQKSLLQVYKNLQL